MCLVYSHISVLLALFLRLTLHGVHPHLLVILLQGRQILTGLGELSLLHTLSHVPVHEGALGVHQVELVVKTSPGLGDGGGVAQHTHGTLDLSQVTAWHDGWWLVVDADLETSWTPVDELDGAFGLDGCDRSVDVFGDDVTTVQHAAGHVFAVTRVALDHLVCGLETGVGDLGNRQLLVVGFLSGNDGGVGGQREVDTRIGHQVGLELRQVDVECAIKSQRRRDGTHNLTNQAVEIGVGGALDVQITTTDVVDGFIVNHEGAIGVLERGVGGEDGVVRLHHSRGHLRRRVDRELQLGLLAIVNGQTFHQERREARSGAATE